MISWLNHVLLRGLWVSECHCGCISVTRSTPLLRGFGVIFSFSVITSMPLFMLMLSFGPYLAFLSPWRAPGSLWAASFWHTEYCLCLSCVDIFFYPSFFCLLSAMSVHIYWCIFLLCLSDFCLIYGGRYYTFLFITHSLEIVLYLIFLHCIPFYAYALLLTSFLLMAI